MCIDLVLQQSNPNISSYIIKLMIPTNNKYKIVKTQQHLVQYIILSSYQCVLNIHSTYLYIYTI